jgi:hypothetical protein
MSKQSYDQGIHAQTIWPFTLTSSSRLSARRPERRPLNRRGLLKRTNAVAGLDIVTFQPISLVSELAIFVSTISPILLEVYMLWPLLLFHGAVNRVGVVLVALIAFGLR